MHDIEPYFKWRDHYVAAEDQHSPFHGQQYDEFKFSTKIYNYYIHPQWDHFGSQTLYIKVLYVDYLKGYAIMELIGEWNDCIGNDIMYLKREIIDKMLHYDITKFVVICDNVLNFHASDDSYYEEWWDDVKEEDGWICLVNTFEHVAREMDNERLNYYVNYGPFFNDFEWRRMTPQIVFQQVAQLISSSVKGLNN